MHCLYAHLILDLTRPLVTVIAGSLAHSSLSLWLLAGQSSLESDNKPSHARRQIMGKWSINIGPTGCHRFTHCHSMHPKVFLCWMSFLPQPSLVLGLETCSEYAGLHSAYHVARQTTKTRCILGSNWQSKSQEEWDRTQPTPYVNISREPAWPGMEHNSLLSTEKNGDKLWSTVSLTWDEFWSQDMVQQQW